MTSHLESTKDHAKERKNQLKKALAHMSKADPDRTVVFGGDLNLRDNEVTDIVPLRLALAMKFSADDILKYFSLR